MFQTKSYGISIFQVTLIYFTNYIIHGIFSMYFSHEFKYHKVLYCDFYISTAKVTVLQGALVYNRTNLIIK